VAVFFLGPQPAEPLYSLTLPEVPSDADGLENYVKQQEEKHKIKEGNSAEIVWFDSTRQKTEYAILYLHGFSASKMEGEPVHRKLAKEFGCNLYLSRLSDHGVDTTETLLLYTADRAWESAKEALAIGQQLGRKVILLSTSTGGTLALKLAADYPDKVFALINMSPNIAINNGAAFLLNGPWGLQIARMVMGGEYRITGASEEHARYWNKKYRLEALTQLEELVETTMTKETFQKVKQPSLTLYYYKNEEEQDPEVKVSAMLDMNKMLGTPADLKEVKAFPKAGAHVIGSTLVSHDVDGVYHTMEDFMQHKLHIPPASNR
jgi:esterase/lipase